MAFPFPPGGGGLPPHVQLPIGPGGPGGPGGPPPGIGPGGPPGGAGGIPGKADSPQVSQLVSQAADALQRALAAEKDPIDKAMLADLVAQCHKFAGDQQALVDKATGAGPGARVIRKTAPAPGM